MAVISINELKARFLTADRPSQKDFVDLIDTLLAGTDTAIPSGAAGGDLAGTYPSPSIAANAVTFAKMQAISPGVSGKLLGRGSAGLGDMEEIPVGAGLAVLGGALTWTGGGGGGGGGSAVAGAISTYTSDPVAIPATDGDLPLIQAPISFGATLPQLIRVVAVCGQPWANYAIGDEVPLEFFRDYADPDTPSFTVVSYVQGGQVTVKVKVELGDILGSNGISIFDRNLTSGPPSNLALIPFSPGSPPEDFFAIKVYMARYVPGTGMGSLALFEPADQVLPAAGGLATFTHNYGTVPNMPVSVSLVCVIADPATGHTAGEMVPVHSTFETAFANPAFGVTLTNSTILVRREATTIELPHKTTGALTAVTADANWQLRVRTSRGVNLPSISFPALQMLVANPFGCGSYKDRVYAVHYDRHNGNRSFLSKLDLTTNRVTMVHQYSPRVLYGNWSMFRSIDARTVIAGAPVPGDIIMSADQLGIRRISMVDELQVEIYSSNSHTWKIMDIKEDGLGAVLRPDMLMARCNYSSADGDTHQHRAQRLVWNGSSYVHGWRFLLNWANMPGCTGPYSDYQAYHPNNANLHFCAYNPIKRRVYLLDDATGYLFIFKLSGIASGASLYEWWETGAPDYTQIAYEKAMFIGGGSDGYQDMYSEQYFIEFDGVTGEEKSITYNRRVNTSLLGSVTRVPWNE